MRKQDRIRQEQNRAGQQSEQNTQPRQKEREQMKGDGSAGKKDVPERHAGKLPLPD